MKHEFSILTRALAWLRWKWNTLFRTKWLAREMQEIGRYQVFLSRERIRLGDRYLACVMNGGVCPSAEIEMRRTKKAIATLESRYQTEVVDRAKRIGLLLPPVKIGSPR